MEMAASKRLTAACVAVGIGGPRPLKKKKKKKGFCLRLPALEKETLKGVGDSYYFQLVLWSERDFREELFFLPTFGDEVSDSAGSSEHLSTFFCV